MRAPELRTVENQILKAPVPVRRQKSNLLRRHWLTGALIFVSMGALIYCGTLFYEAEVKLAEMRREKQDMISQVERLRAKNLDMQEDIAHLNDPGYVEQVAKQLLGMAYPGETVVRPSQSVGTGQ